MGKSKPKAKAAKFHGCVLKQLPAGLQVAAAETAIRTNPANAPMREMAMAMIAVDGGGTSHPDVLPAGRLAVLTSRYWGAEGVRLTVGFMESVQAPLRDKIVLFMNRWSAFCNVKFAWTQTDPQVRISRGRGGYYSYLGTDVLHIPRNEQTMNLEGFTLQTPDAEFARVVCHETGHTLGFPHEHLRRDLVAKLDAQKTIAYFQRTQGWSAEMVRQQVLTPIDEGSLLRPTPADALSIMTYSLPGSITRDGQPIIGGSDIDEADRQYAGGIYPLAVQPPPPPPPPVDPPARRERTLVVKEDGTWLVDGRAV